MKRDSKGNPLNKDPQHVRLYAWLLESAAWRDLTPDARSVYLLLKQGYTGNNNGRLVLSVRQVADELSVGKTTSAKALDELIAHGFIEVVIRGSFGGRKDGRATEYRLTEHQCNRSGDLPSKKFMRWQPGSNFTVRPEVQLVPERGPAVPERGPTKAHIPRTVLQRGL